MPCLSKKCVSKPRLKGYDIRAKNLASEQLAILSNTHLNQPSFKPFNTKEIITSTNEHTKNPIAEHKDIINKDETKQKKAQNILRHEPPINTNKDKEIINIEHVEIDKKKLGEERSTVQIPRASITIESESSINKSNSIITGRHVRLPFTSKQNTIQPFISKNKCQCKCGSDTRFNCCIKAATWLDKAYKNNYEAEKCRELYEVKYEESIEYS